MGFDDTDVVGADVAEDNVVESGSGGGSQGAENVDRVTKFESRGGGGRGNRGRDCELVEEIDGVDDDGKGDVVRFFWELLARGDFPFWGCVDGDGVVEITRRGEAVERGIGFVRESFSGISASDLIQVALFKAVLW